MNKEEGLKIISAEIQNFKNISHRLVDINGRHVIIVGKNGAGKSSLIQAIMSPLNAKFIPSKAIKQGEEKGRVEIVLAGNLHGEYQKYTLDMNFSEQHQSGRITVYNKEGEKIGSSRSVSDSIIGAIGFDIFQFIRMGLTPTGEVSKPGVQGQIEELKKLMPKEVLVKLHDLDIEYDKIDKIERSVINKEIKTLEAEIKGMPEYSQEEIEKYSKPDEDKAKELEDKLDNIALEIDKWTRVSNGTKNAEEKIKGIDDTIEELQAKITSLIEEKTKLEEAAEKGKAWLIKNTKPEPDAIITELKETRQFNEKCKEVKKYEDKHKDLGEKKATAKKHTSRLEEIKSEKKEIFSKGALPVKDLSFNETEILYKGLPFNEEQHPKSTIIAIGMKIAMAMNPNLRCVVINDGSLLDEKTRNLVFKIADKEGYHIIMEVVDEKGGDLDIQFVESK